MCTRKFLLAFLLLLFQLKAFSAVFVVTSNADSGPGTLRDALTQAAANGTTEKDYINFNLPDVSVAGRTINLTAQLPDVTGNLVIDGTTQPGIAYGVSDAKVALFYNTPINQKLTGLYIREANDVSIYGLYIKNIADVSKANLIYFWTGIDIEGGSNIQIGAPGKGNVVVGFQTALSTNTAVNADNETYEITTGLIIKDNIFSIDADGETLSVNPDGGVGVGGVLGNINIGGTPAEGNTFAKGLAVDQDNSDSPLATILISNNKVGVDYTVQTAIPNSGGIIVSSVDPNGDDIVSIVDNVIASQSGQGSIEIENIGPKINVLRNYIGTDKTLQKSFKIQYYGIFVYGATVAIGSTDPADANYITNCKPIVIYPYSDVSVNKNSFFCTINEYPMHFANSSEGERPYPGIIMSKIEPNKISGWADPNSSVELFYSDKCNTCSPQTYFASVTADNQGNWSYNGPITGTVIASATLNGNTSEFTFTGINVSKVNITNACNNNGTGSITGAVPVNATTSTWVDKNGKIVGHDPDLLNVPPGMYKLIVQYGGCADSTSYYQIKPTFTIDSAKLKKINPSCNNNNGSVSGITVTENDNGGFTAEWKDTNGKSWSSTTALKNVPAGAYTLYITNADKSCSTTYGPVILKNTTGPNIDQSEQKIQPTNCGQSTGSITNIQVSGGTGNYQYVWWNDQEITVGTDKDLIGQPAGVYKLEVTDGGPCGAIYSSEITIPEINGIMLDESKAATGAATCGLSNGSVTGIMVTGATTYVWTDASGKTYTTPSADLTNAPAGTYTLTASNSTCSKTSDAYTILQRPPTQYPVFSYTSHGTCKNASIGSIIISINTDNLVKSLRWVNSAGQNVGYNAEVDNLPEGTYQLYFTDYAGCETFYNSYTINAIPPLTIVPGSEQEHNDQCKTGTGSIRGIKVEGGLTPYTFSWTNANGNTVGQTADLVNVPAGDYTLMVTDASGCGPVTAIYNIQNDDADISPPAVNNVQLCSPGAALLQVTDPSANYSYRLYNSATNPTPVDEQKSGIFKITADANSSFYVSQFLGDCESSRTKVNITVGISALNIANAFTPNGDGINDYWQIKDIGNYPDALIQVFNRNGQKVFESKGYSIPFNGTYKGQPLPAGAYYYIINMGIKCNILSGSLTIIR